MYVACELDKTPKVIKGHKDIELIVSEIYEIHYGIHQGEYIYVGKVNSMPKNKLFESSYLFKKLNAIGDDISFSFYADAEPYLFTSIISKPRTV